MSRFDTILEELQENPKTFLITGVAGFIGANLLEMLLLKGQRVIGLDNFATGHRHNLDDVRQVVGEDAWKGFQFVEGDICDADICARACDGVDYVLHQAALGSVPRSLEDPVRTNRANIDGFLNMLVAARDAGVQRFVYAASSSTYGDHPGLPKVEDTIGKPLSPYAVTKYVNELYAEVFAHSYGISCIGLRYFNVFGPRQDPEGAYAAVIPRWIGELLSGQAPRINGDGETSRDFCFIHNTVQANILAAMADNPEADNTVYNVAVGGRTSLSELFSIIRGELSAVDGGIGDIEAEYGEFRAGDVRHSQADISRARELLGYDPVYDASAGLALTCAWFARQGEQ